MTMNEETKVETFIAQTSFMSIHQFVLFTKHYYIMTKFVKSRSFKSANSCSKRIKVPRKVQKRSYKKKCVNDSVIKHAELLALVEKKCVCCSSALFPFRNQ